MDELKRLAGFIKERNQIHSLISSIIGRPATTGHLGEFIASKIFDIRLEESASAKGIDGYFIEGPLSGKSVNIKWYGKQDGLLAINPEAVPGFYLVFTGPKSSAMSSRGQIRPWVIERVYLFDGPKLIDILRSRGIKFSVATSVRQHLWKEAEIYPSSNNIAFEISNNQRKMLEYFK
jgi:hypothetical protein